MIVIWCGISLFFGYLAGIFSLWFWLRPGLLEIQQEAIEMAALFEPLGYKLVEGAWTKPDDPTWKLGQN